MRPKSDLRNAQRWAVNTLKRPWSKTGTDRLPGVILAWDMGAGKSAAVLTAVRDLLDQFVIRKVLIVARLLVAQTTWPDEIEGWEHLKALTWTLIRVEDDDPALMGIPADIKLNVKNSKLARLAATDTDIHIINKEALPWLWENFGDGKRWPYDLIVVDEVLGRLGKKRSTGGKKEGGPREKAPLSRFGVLSRARKYVDAVIQLTGTPAPNGLQNLWSLAYPIDLGERLGSSRTAFERRWFNTSRYSYEVEPKANAEAEITAALKDIMFSLDPADYPELPPVFNNIVKVCLPDKILKEYRRFARSLVSEEYDVEAVNKGVLHGKLLQFANGSMYREEGNDIPIHDFKLQALEHIVEETDGEPLLVAYSFLFDLERIRRKFPKAIVLNETNPRDTMKLWNAGKIRMLLAHPLSAGHGLNFQFGGHHAVWFGLTSDLELYQQFNKRLPRPGQLKPVFCHHIIAENTIDEDILPIYLDPKAATQARVLEAVRVILSTGESK